MAVAFARTLRSLSAQRPRRAPWAVLLVALLLAGWGWWLLRAELTVYELSGDARLEVQRRAHSVQAPVGGQVIASHLEIGRAVEAGDVLVELDAEQENLRLAETDASLAGLRGRLVALDAAIGAEDTVATSLRAAARARLDELEVQAEVAREALGVAENIVARWEEIFGTTKLSEVDLLRARSDAQEIRGQIARLEAQARSVAEEERVKDASQRAKLAGLVRERAQLAGELQRLEAERAALLQRIAARRILAPVAGVLGEVGDFQLGSVVQLGERVAAIIPEGQLKIVASFPPDAALGRVRPGQSARLRLYGFSWTQYGSVPARVTHVAGEPREGRVQVELEPTPEEGSAIPLQHGLPGTVEIALEDISPFALVLRSVGKLVETRAP